MAAQTLLELHDTVASADHYKGVISTKCQCVKTELLTSLVDTYDSRIYHINQNIRQL